MFMFWMGGISVSGVLLTLTLFGWVLGFFGLPSLLLVSVATAICGVYFIKSAIPRWRTRKAVV